MGLATFDFFSILKLLLSIQCVIPRKNLIDKIALRDQAFKVSTDLEMKQIGRSLESRSRCQILTHCPYAIPLIGHQMYDQNFCFGEDNSERYLNWGGETHLGISPKTS